MEMMNVEISIPKMVLDNMTQDGSITKDASLKILAVLAVIGIVQSDHGSLSFDELSRIDEWGDEVLLSVGCVL